MRVWSEHEQNKQECRHSAVIEERVAMGKEEKLVKYRIIMRGLNSYRSCSRFYDLWHPSQSKAPSQIFNKQAYLKQTWKESMFHSRKAQNKNSSSK